MDTNLALGLGGLVVGIVGTAFGVVGVLLTIKSNRLLTKGIKAATLQHLDMLIKRLEEEKMKFPVDSVARLAMHHTQQDLDAQLKSLRMTFDISDKAFPLP